MLEKQRAKSRRDVADETPWPTIQVMLDLTIDFRLLYVEASILWCYVVFVDGSTSD